MPSRGDGSSLRDIGLLSVVAAGLRLPYLGYSEFQGDETEVMLRAAGAVQATRDALFYHGKGPGEIVVVSTLYGLVGAINEAAARLPFALAGVLGVLAFYLLARRLIGWPGALVAGLLLATNGFFLAFSRITQYQTVVLLLGTLAIWCAVRWSVGGSGVWPTLAGAFAATAALAHYDASFVLPPIVVALLWRTGLRNTFNLRVVWPWLCGAALGLLILAAFFVPYLTNPLFALATDRFADRVGAGFPYNNLGAIVAAGALYLGPVLPLLVMALIVLGVVATILRRASAPSRRVWLFGIVWALVPFLFYAFVARKPGHPHPHGDAGTDAAGGRRVPGDLARAWQTATHRPVRFDDGCARRRRRLPRADLPLARRRRSCTPTGWRCYRCPGHRRAAHRTRSASGFRTRSAGRRSARSTPTARSAAATSRTSSRR